MIDTKYYTVETYGWSYVVTRPDGTRKCSVDDFDFAKQIADEANMELYGHVEPGSRTKPKGRKSKPVIWVETGKVFEGGVVEAAKEMDISIDTLRKDIRQHIRIEPGVTLAYVGEDTADFRDKAVRFVPHNSPVICIETGKTYKSTAEAAEDAGVERSRINTGIWRGTRVNGKHYAWYND
jgi:hypothetical protein